MSMAALLAEAPIANGGDHGDGDLLAWQIPFRPAVAERQPILQQPIAAQDDAQSTPRHDIIDT